MTVMTWDPMGVFDDVMRNMPEWTTDRNDTTRADWVPAVDVIETAEDYRIEVELAEVAREDVKVSIEDDMLHIEGERRVREEENGRTFHRVERPFGRFSRTFVVPDDANRTTVTATFKDGLLTVRMLKTEKAKARNIEVELAA